MFSRHFIFNEQSLSIIEQFGEHMPGGFFIYKADESEELLYANKAVCHIFGCEDLEEFRAFSGFTFRGMIHPEDYDRVSSSIKEQIDENRSDLDYVEYRIIRRDGETRWIDDYGHYVESEVYSGLYYVFISDITDKHRQAESDKALRSAVIEALTRVYDSVWLINDLETQRFELYRIDEEMVHLMPAQTAVKITRFSDAFAFYSNLVLEEDRAGFLEAVSPEKIIKNTENTLIYSVPFRRVFEHGIRYYRLEFARLDLPDGKTGIVAGFKDVDDEVRKEQQIQQALREAIDAANASNKAKSDFLSSMSHDMRTPMNGIIGMTTIAANHLDDRERVADCLRKITESSSHLLSLINEVLDMNKIESGKVELQEEEFCLAELIDKMLTMTRPQLQAKGHSFRIHIEGVEHEYVIGDSRRIEQVFINIMSNAIKYTPDGGKISLSVRETPTRTQGFGHYQFVFEDNGYGMTEEFQKRLFEPFSRANDRQTAGIQGTGLGMAITRNIVRMMGGDVTVESVYGEGSKFTVNIYLKLQNTADIDYSRFVDLRVLIADDDPVCCESTCEIIGEMGMNSEWVLSGKAAVDRVKARLEQGRDFFTIIIDWKLPDQGGVETTRQIRKLVGEDVPIIIFSAYDWTDIEQEAREAGATAFISKPLFRTKLAALFESLINNHPEDVDLDASLKNLEELELEGCRVLLTEDQEINAEIAMDFLEMTGLDVDWARDGEEAVEKLAASPDGYYSMIFMDLQMPNMNGYEATQAIRAMDRSYAKEIPIVAMTANAFTDDMLKCKKAGMNEHITKPIDVDILARVLETYVHPACV
ncbi:MAG: response regulator [Eubacterium sp.]|nr:response regulator [Eubacterium sp.]